MIAVRIQHHPSRADLLPDLLAALAPLPVEVVAHSSDPPSPWAGYLRCLDSPPDASHLLILQDDAVPCAGFSEVLPQIAERHPTEPVCLFMGALPAATCAQMRRARPNVRYIPLGVGSFVPLVACLWPTQVAQRFYAWGKGRPGRADDGIAAKWARKVKQQFWVTVPSLVEHNDYVESVKGGRQHKPGAERWRQALLLADDARNYDWLSL